MESTRAPKGTVSVEVLGGFLRLRWRYQGKRYSFSLGMPDNKGNHKKAQGTAWDIERDMYSGNFDESLERYRPHQFNRSPAPAKPVEAPLTCAVVFDAFTRHKALYLHSRSLEKYILVSKYLQDFYPMSTPSKPLGEKAAHLLTRKEAQEFSAWLQAKGAERARKEKLVYLSSCWKWLTEESEYQEAFTGVVWKNPWLNLDKQVRQEPKQAVRPFTVVEVGQIIKAFQVSEHYAHYAPFVEFLFATGCRTGEAIGLHWEHIEEDCSSIWFGTSKSRAPKPQVAELLTEAGKSLSTLKSTKTNSSRNFPCNQKLQELLLSQKERMLPRCSQVFPSPKAGYIDDHNFRNRAWVKTLEAAGVAYRKPYNTRHTFVSHALYSGMAPGTVASLTGHSVKVLFDKYSGTILLRPTVPDLY